MKKVKVLLECKACGRQFIHTATKGRYPEKCRECTQRWEFIGTEETSFGVVMVYRKGDKVRKVLKE